MTMVAAVAVLALFPACASHLAVRHSASAVDTTVTTAHLVKPTLSTVALSSSPPPAPAPARHCSSGDLSGRINGIQGAGQNQVGGIAVWNTSGSPCRLYGPVSFTARYADGRPDSNIRQAQRFGTLVVTLPARGSPIARAGVDAQYALAMLNAPEFRSDGGTCYDQLNDGPASFVLTFHDVRLTVPNVNRGYGSWRAFSGCAGGIWLDEVRPPGPQ